MLPTRHPHYVKVAYRRADGSVHYIPRPVKGRLTEMAPKPKQKAAPKKPDTEEEAPPDTEEEKAGGFSPLLALGAVAGGLALAFGVSLLLKRVRSSTQPAASEPAELH